ncbi:hypothetical protein LOK49_LG04G02489 [Camellia lanceoleosa]|uniref:Uncharacterized protein n=1 Tax=Camellia lanceoleosa TaxID=1840588 RepID=A0ACC0I098_9ERIC|nr:hypothetical protein LOK49_LG04G02489 [Camellia lanceoleosa]
MGSTLLPDLATEIVIPVCAVVGIVFSLVQWLLVSQVKLSADRNASSTTKNKNCYTDYLIEEEEGANEHNVVAKCAEIHNAISEDISLWRVYTLDFAHYDIRIALWRDHMALDGSSQPLL